MSRYGRSVSEKGEKSQASQPQIPGGGVIPSKRLLNGDVPLDGSHFRNWTDYNGVTFLVELLEWGRTFSGFLG